MSLAFDLIRFRVHKRPYSSIRAIMAEMGQSDTTLLIALAKLHDIHIDTLKTDPVIFFTEDTNQLEQLSAEGVESPTMLQVLLTSKAFALTEDDVKIRWEKIMQKLNAEPSGEN